MDKGPVFYEAYYPDTRDAYQKKRYFDRSTVLERSFQVPFERMAYSAESADHPASINESLVVVDNDEILPREQREAVGSRSNYDAANQRKTLASSHNERSTIFDDDKNSQVANIEEISKLVRRAISRDLENWNALEGYLDRTIHQDRPMPQLGMYSREDVSKGDGGSYVSKDSSKRLSFEASLPRRLDARDANQQPIRFEGVDANGGRMTSEISASVSGTQAVDTSPSIDITSDSLPPENIFQPRPQLIRYTFFKRPENPFPRLDKRNAKTIGESTRPRIYAYGDNLIREKIADDNRGRRVEENVKVTSIEISELPRHKTRHHHGEWPKRDYSIHRHRSQSAVSSYPTVS